MKNKTASFIYLLAILSILVSAGASQAFSGAGSGTEQDPYIITNVYQLQEVNNDLDAWYELGNDIDASGTKNWNSGAGFTPIGNDSNYFAGHFDGKGHAITALYINQQLMDGSGLFGGTDYDSNIKNVALINVDITGVNYVGGLVGYNEGMIFNCCSSGSIGGHTQIGGLAGISENGGIWNSSSSGSVSGSNHIGGLVGSNVGTGSTEDCYSTASVSGDSYVGGFVGNNNWGFCDKCYSMGSVAGTGIYVGGLIGRNEDGECNNCFWDIECSGQTVSAGGLGKTNMEMMWQATFANWDFVNIWDIVEGVTYPFLRENNQFLFIDFVPYIHQCYDTPRDFCGSEACGATSAVMLLAGMNRIVPWPNDHMDTCCESGCTKQGEHASDYGNYVCREYTCAGTTWDEQTYDYGSEHIARGAYGYIHHNPGDPDNHSASGYRIQEFLYKHGIHGNDINDPPEYIREPDPTIDYVKSELAKGRLLIASTMLTPAKHFVLITAYDPVSDLFIVNDPFGSKPYASSTCGDYGGNSVLYTWHDMCNDGNCLNSTISIAGCKDLDNNFPPEPNSATLKQFRPGGQTEIAFGELITLPTVVFKGFVEDNSAPLEVRDSVRLEIELRRLGEYGGRFTGEPTHRSNFTPNWFETERSITVSGLRPGQYHWSARTVDIRGEKSPWVSAGNNDDSEADFSIGIIMYLCSPADMIVTDPEGLTISKELNQIQGATYEEIDVNGVTHDVVSIPGQKVGNYSVDVIPDQNASPADTYSLMLEVDDMTVILADNVQIRDIPTEPYIFESKLNRSDFDGDGDVDFYDLCTLSLHWLEQDCNYPDWCEGTDLNYNRFVDFIDFTLFAQNWLWEKIIADINIDGDVDFVDYAAFASRWMDVDCNEPDWCSGADLNKSTFVDFADLSKFTEHWLERNNP